MIRPIIDTQKTKNKTQQQLQSQWHETPARVTVIETTDKMEIKQPRSASPTDSNYGKSNMNNHNYPPISNISTIHTEHNN